MDRAEESDALKELESVQNSDVSQERNETENNIGSEVDFTVLDDNNFLQEDTCLRADEGTGDVTIILNRSQNREREDEIYDSSKDLPSQE